MNDTPPRASLLSAGFALEARLLEAVQQAVIATDLQGRVIFWNGHATRLFGWSSDEALGRSILELTPHESAQAEAAAIMEKLARGESWAGEFRLRRKDGGSFVAFVVNSPLLDDDGRLVGVVGVSTEISPPSQTEKLEALGQLAGAIAPDCHDLLTRILGKIEHVMTLPTGAPETRRGLHELRDDADRAAALIRQLLAAARR